MDWRDLVEKNPFCNRAVLPALLPESFVFGIIVEPQSVLCLLVDMIGVFPILVQMNETWVRPK